MAETGVLGGKAAGAGAGGSMFFLVTEPSRAASAARQAGARVLPVAWSPEGVRVW
jgi:galactokinase/mevalonate kinase-like predicted kinase